MLIFASGGLAMPVEWHPGCPRGRSDAPGLAAEDALPEPQVWIGPRLPCKPGSNARLNNTEGEGAQVGSAQWSYLRDTV